MSPCAESKNVLANVEMPKLILCPTNPPSETPKLQKPAVKLIKLK